MFYDAFAKWKGLSWMVVPMALKYEVACAGGVVKIKVSIARLFRGARLKGLFLKI